jgi:sugar lactone lactonase YvrE
MRDMRSTPWSRTTFLISAATLVTSLGTALAQAPAPAQASAAPAKSPAPPAPTAPAAAAPARKVIPVGTRPESVTRGFGGKLYISVMNASDVEGDGVVKVIDGDQVKDFATGFDEPKGICFNGKLLFVTDVKRVWRIDAKGEKSPLVDEDDFPQPPSFLNDIACEPGGKAVYVTDMGANTKMRDPNKKLWPLDSPEAKALPAIGRVYRIDMKYKIKVAVDSSPQMPNPNGVAAPGPGRLLVAEFFTGTIFEPKGKTLNPLVTGLRGADGLEEDARRNIYVSSWEQGKVWRFRRGTPAKPAQPELLAEGFQSAADFFLDSKGKQLLLPDMKAGTLTFIPLPP